MKDTSREENGSSKVDRILVSFTLFIPFSYRPVTVPPGGMEGEEMNRVNHARLCRSVPVTHILTLSGQLPLYLGNIYILLFYFQFISGYYRSDKNLIIGFLYSFIIYLVIILIFFEIILFFIYFHLIFVLIVFIYWSLLFGNYYIYKRFIR